MVVGDALRVHSAAAGPLRLRAASTRRKEDYLDYLRQLEPKAAPGAVVVADNTGVFRKDVGEYLAYVRDPAGRWESREYDFGDDTMEVSVLRGRD